MSSMLWAAAAAAAAPLPVTAEQLLERAREYYAVVENETPEECSESREGEIVVCRVISDPDQYRVPSPTDEGRTDNGIPRAPNVSGLPDCSQATCIRMGKQPRQVKLIDLGAIPEAPEGSDADRIAKGEMAAP